MTQLLVDTDPVFNPQNFSKPHFPHVVVSPTTRSAYACIIIVKNCEA